ncbi:MAG: cobalamin synthase-like protein [Ramlibacter sp.]|nr:cobalamin synthase-like protein [Ramlibacter sp.]
MPDLRATFVLFLRRCLAATRAFTRIPIIGSLAEWAQLEPANTAASARHWPGVGVLAGMAACIVFALVSLPLPRGPLSPLVAAVAATIATALLTGGRHEESLARHAGTVALVLVLAAKLALLALLGLHSPAGVLAALVGAHAVSRLFALLLAWSLPPLPGQPADHPLLQQADRSALAAAAAWCVLPLLLMWLAAGLQFTLIALVTGALAFGLLRRRLQRQGGVGVDGIGAAQQICEAAIYLGAAFGVPR